MTILVFLGPSVPIDAARAELDAKFLPPCAMGDVYAAVQRHAPRAIGIIDGFFEQTPAVWHKEILYAMERGVEVFGASSMGALRAAELAAFGMRGIGRIFEAYATGVIEDDDEVAVAHLRFEEGYRLVSEPMVNIRYGLELARDAGLVTPGEAAALTVAAKARYYPERSWSALWASEAARALAPKRLAALRTFVAERRPDLKREDGLELLRRLRSWRPAVAVAPAFQFEPTIFWEHLCAYRGGDAADDATEVSRERLLDHLRFGGYDREALLDDALLLHLAEQEASRLAIGIPDDRAALGRFRRDRGLTSTEALRRWMGQQRVGTKECLALARAEALRRTLRRRFAEAINVRLPQVLKCRGRYGAALEEVAAKWRRLAVEGVGVPSEADVESMDVMLAWYQATYGPVTTTMEEHVAELGFGSAPQFAAELTASYLVARMDRVEMTDAA